jgi:peptidoglycan hydrolase-like protein with peptidoglycan-binding domain
MRATATGVIMLLGLAACAGEPSDGVAVPGAPPGGDPRPSISTVAPAATTRPPSTAARTTTTVAVTTTVAPTTTIAVTTTIPPTTVPAATSTVAPTTTELVYSPEPADGSLRTGVEGPRSLQVQQQLIALAILPSTAADSKYGPGTAAGVRRFQESKGLVVDGVAGSNTITALNVAVAALTPPTTAA